MKNNALHKPLFTSLTLACLTILSGIVINVLTDNEDFKHWLKTYGVGIRGIVGAATVIAFLTLSLAYLQGKDSQLADAADGDVEPDIKRLFESLKKRYRSRYLSKLDGRFEMTLEVGESSDGLNPHSITERSDEAGKGQAVETIREALEEKGRLLIVGDAGAGKTTLLLKLALSLLEKVEPAKEEAFPVIFDIASWSPEYEGLEDWLRASLESGHGLSKDLAATLLHQGRIIFLLDGLNELAIDADERLAAKTRGEFLRALNEYLSRGKKVVVSCRRDEYARMRALERLDAPVAATVALSDLTGEQIRKALSEAEARKDGRGDKVDEAPASHLREFLRRDGGKVLLDAIRTPFYFTTALEVFDKPILESRRIPDDTGGLKRYLLDTFVDKKLRSTPNRKRFKPEKTKRWLKWLGRELECTHSVDFELSDLQPDSLRRAWLYELLHGSAAASGVLLCFGWVYGVVFGSYVLFKLLDGSYLGAGRYTPIQTEDVRRVNAANLKSGRKLKRGLISGLAYGVPACLVFNLRGLSAGGVVAASALGAFVGVREVLREVSYFVKVDAPYQRLKAGFVEKGLILSLVSLLINALSLRVNYNESVLDHKLLLVFSLVGGAVIGFSSTPLFRHLVLRLCLYLEGAAPLKYAAFLDYASDARILEKDGGRWRFRHQTLQEYFADMKRVGVRRVTTEL